MRIRKAINKVLICIICRILNFETKLMTYNPNKNSDHKKVLLVYCGIIGDAVIFLPYLKYIEEAFDPKKYDVDILFRSASKMIVDRYGDIPKNINIFDFVMDGIEESIVTFLRIRNKLKKVTYDYIYTLPITNPGVDRFIHTLYGINKIQCGASDIRAYIKKENKNIVQKLLSPDNVYNASFADSLDTTENKRYQLFFIRFGVKADSLLSSIRYELKKTRDSYCIVSAGASGSDKKWDVEKYVQLILRINGVFKINIALCGDKSDIEDSIFIENELRNRGVEVVNYTGKTSIEEWINLIGNALFYVGNDSAGVHIAAAVGTPSVVIVGKFQYLRFYPYQVEKDYSFLPTPVYSKEYTDCSCCREISGRRGGLNKKCFKEIRDGGACLCIKSISVDDVFDVVEKVIIKNKIISSIEV